MSAFRSFSFCFTTLPMLLLLLCIGQNSAYGQCQTITLTNLATDGDTYNETFGYQFQYVGEPSGDTLLYDSVIYLGPKESQTFNIGTALGTQFPIGQYVLTLFGPQTIFGNSVTNTVKVTLGTGLSFSTSTGSSNQQTFSLTTGQNSVPTTISNLTAFCSAYTPAPVQLLDPTPLIDPLSSLMAGNNVSADRGVLSSGGRPVKGIAADGTAQIVVRIPIQNKGDTVTATVLSDQCTVVSFPPSCSASGYAPDDGGFIPFGNVPNATAVSQASSTGDAMGFAYFLYQAPTDFVRLYGSPNDPTVHSRTITFQLVYSSASGTKYGLVYAPLSIVRPPTILIHGYAASAKETWSDFSIVTMDKRTTVSKVDYSADISVASTSPSIVCALSPNVFDPYCENFRQSDLGFTYNTPVVAPQVVSFIEDFAVGNNPLSPAIGSGTPTPVAVSQADIVAHSMGGLVARYWSTNPAKASLYSDSAMFLHANNFGKGYIHKLVTLGTPHFGSPFASGGVDKNAFCFRSVSTVPFRYIIGTATFADGTIENGAVGDLAGDGIGIHLNSSLAAIQSGAQKLPTVTVAGDLTKVGGFALPIIYGLCGLPTIPAGIYDPVARRFTPSLYNTLFDPALYTYPESYPSQPKDNDGVVPVTSALMNGSCSLPGNYCASGYAHGGGTASLVGSSMNLVDASGVIATLVEKVLNTSINDISVWNKR